MEYICYNMNAYNLHIVNTKKFKTITVDICFREKINKEMLKASEAMNYERALELKTMLEDIDITLRRQKIDLNNNYNFDLINYYVDKNYLSIQVFFVRDGLLVGRNKDIISSDLDVLDQVVEYILKFLVRKIYSYGSCPDKSFQSIFYVPYILTLSFLTDYSMAKQ